MGVSASWAGGAAWLGPRKPLTQRGSDHNTRLEPRKAGVGGHPAGFHPKAGITSLSAFQCPRPARRERPGNGGARQPES